MKKFIKFGVVSIFVILLCSFAQAQVLQFAVPLRGNQAVEVPPAPPVVTPAIGTGTVTVDMTAQTISGSVTFSGLTGLTQAGHIHLGAANANGGIIINLTGGIGVTAGTMTLPLTTFLPGQFDAFRTNGLYFQVHTATFPGGELRGQIILPRVDFSINGQTDILWRNVTTGQNVIWVMNGTTFASAFILPSVADLNWEIEGAADFNGDAITDIVWRNTLTGDNVVWIMNGGALVSAVFLPSVADVNWKIAGLADFNSDGRTDILWRNEVNGGNVIWLMNGTTFASAVFLPSVVDVNWEIVGAGDLDSDAQTDILWRNRVTGVNVLWLMNGATFMSAVFLPVVADANWDIAGIGDFNSDGQTDILWRNGATGDNVVWMMNGTTFVNAGFVPAVADVNWRIVAP